MSLSPSLLPLIFLQHMGGLSLNIHLDNIQTNKSVRKYTLLFIWMRQLH